MSRLLAAACAILLALAAGASAKTPVKSPVKLKVGDAAPQFVRTDLQGKKFDLRAQRGKVVLVDFWASWCPPCIIAVPHLGQLQKKYGGRGFQVVGVSMDDAADTTKETMRNIPFHYPVVMGDARLGTLYGGVLGLPVQFLVGADGKIRAIRSGDFPPDALDKEIAAALKRQK